MANELMVTDFSSLLTYIEHIRLLEDEKIIKTKLEKNKIEEAKGNTWNKFKIGLDNFRKTVVSSAGNYENKNKDIKDELNKFNKNNPKIISDKEASALILSLSKQDPTNVASLLFDINVILDDNYKYVYEGETLAKGSEVLHNDNSLNELKKKLEKTYRSICNKNLSANQKTIFAVVAAASLASLALTPVAGVITASLCGVAIPSSLLLLSTALVGATACGLTYGGMKLYNSEQIKKAYRSLNVEQTAIQLAIQCLVIEQLKKTLSEDEFKNRLDKILTEINMLKSDTDYMLFVEKANIATNKEKIKLYFGFENCLVDVLGL